METTSARSGLDTKMVRARIAESGIWPSQFAKMAGMSVQNLSDIMYGRASCGPERTARIERALAELERNPPPRRVVHRGKTRAEQLRAEQLASGGPTIRYL